MQNSMKKALLARSIEVLSDTNRLYNSGLMARRPRNVMVMVVPNVTGDRVAMKGQTCPP